MINQLVPETLWLSYHDDHIIVKTPTKRYQIKQQQTVQALLTLLPGIQTGHVNAEDIRKMNNPQLNRLLARFPSTSLVDEQSDRVPFLSFLREENVSQNTVRLRLREYHSESVMVAIPTTVQPFIFLGKGMDIIRFMDMHHLQVSGQSTHFSAISDRLLQHSIEFITKDRAIRDRVEIFTMDDSSNDRFIPVHNFEDYLKIGQEIEVEELTFDFLEHYHEPVDHMKKFVTQTPYMFRHYGFEELMQIPFKIATITTLRGAEKMTVLQSEDHPLKALFEVFKLGMMTSLNQREMDEYARWICCSSIEEIYQVGVAPLLFGHMARVMAPFETTRYPLSEDNIPSPLMKRLVQISELFTRGGSPEIEVRKVKGYSLYQVSILVEGVNRIQRYGTSVDQLVEASLRQFYAQHVQKNHPFHQHDQESRHLVDTLESDTAMSTQDDGTMVIEVTRLLQSLEINLSVVEWSHNTLIEKTGTKCFRVSIPNLDGSSKGETRE